MNDQLPPSASPAQQFIPRAKDRHAALIYGLVGVAAFSLTLPATRAAVAGLDPVFVGLGRALVAAALAIIVIIATGASLPKRNQLPALALVAAGVVVGFPLFSAWAMRYVPAAHGAVVIGLLPLATAMAGAWLVHERPPKLFWASAIFGAAVVVGFALYQGSGAPHPADALLFLAVAAAAIGYAEGGRLARAIGGWQVICWALVLSAPLLVVPTLWSADERLFTAPVSSWIASAWLLDERIDAATLVAAALVIASIAIGRTARH